ncbi:MAG: hypothetical protein ACON4Z_13085, partial [Planctomycetota bacterium]
LGALLTCADDPLGSAPPPKPASFASGAGEASGRATVAPSVESPPPSREAPQRERWSPDPDAELATFEQVVAQLCDLSGRTAALAQDDEHEAAKALDDEARGLLATALHRFADAGERALAMVVEMPGVDADEARPAGQNIRLGVLQVVLAAELARRHETARRFEEPDARDQLVAALLTAMPIGSHTAEMGDRVLRDRPFLQLRHEPQVLELLRHAGEGAVARPIATRLLLTLWTNLRAGGLRTSAELSRLALVLLDGADPSQVVVACSQLLTDRRFRLFALAWLRERDDRGLATEVAQIAGRSLPPAEALEVLSALSPLLQHTRGTLLAVGVRAPDLLADAYRTQLAAGTRSALRREMVMGLGMLPDAAGLEIARTALDHDPSAEVRLQAMFVFTVHGTAAGAEAAIHQVLDDPEIANNAGHLGAVVLALQNLEDDDVNAVARRGARLRSLPLSDSSRGRLEELLARCLPPRRP